jgi:uncharacterized protein YkwD
MKSIWQKFFIAASLVAIMVAFCPKAAPRQNQVDPLPAAQEPQPVLPPPGVKYLPKVEDLVIKMTNQARRARGLAPLSPDAELRRAARTFSDDMLVRRFFDHTTPDGVPFYRRIRSHYPHWVRTLGENIWEAYGYEHDSPQRLAQLILADWMGSPGHRDNILDPDYTHLGVGVSARHDTIKVTQEFVGKFQGLTFGKRLTSWLNDIGKRVRPAM